MTALLLGWALGILNLANSRRWTRLGVLPVEVDFEKAPMKRINNIIYTLRTIVDSFAHHYSEMIVTAKINQNKPK